MILASLTQYGEDHIVSIPCGTIPCIRHPHSSICPSSTYTHPIMSSLSSFLAYPPPYHDLLSPLLTCPIPTCACRPLPLFTTWSPPPMLPITNILLIISPSFTPTTEYYSSSLWNLPELQSCLTCSRGKRAKSGLDPSIFHFRAKEPTWQTFPPSFTPFSLLVLFPSLLLTQ